MWVCIFFRSFQRQEAWSKFCHQNCLAISKLSQVVFWTLQSPFLSTHELTIPTSKWNFQFFSPVLDSNLVVLPPSWLLNSGGYLMSLSNHCHWCSVHVVSPRLQSGTTCHWSITYFLFFSVFISVSNRIVYLSFKNINKSSTSLRWSVLKIYAYHISRYT